MHGRAFVNIPSNRGSEICIAHESILTKPSCNAPKCKLLFPPSRDAEFMELECPLTADQEVVYNDAVCFWKVRLTNMLRP